jgi:type II secretory pathway pseudopilin PulG
MEQGMHRKPNHIKRVLRAVREAEQGFTLVEVLAAAVLLTWGMLVLLDVLPRGLRLGELGKDQGAAAALAQQKLEYYKNQSTTTLTSAVGDYGTRTLLPPAQDPQPECFDPNGTRLAGAGSTCAGMVPQTAYFARDTQIQYWIWDSATSKYKANTPTPYTVPGTTPYVFRVSVATYWFVRGAGVAPPGGTTFQVGNPGVPTGCVPPGGNLVARSDPGPVVPMGMGCIQVSAFISP